MEQSDHMRDKTSCANLVSTEVDPHICASCNVHYIGTCSPLMPASFGSRQRPYLDGKVPIVKQERAVFDL